MQDAQLAAMEEALLGNPYLPESRRKRLEIAESEGFPKNLDGWRQWWKELPQHHQNEAMGLVLCVGVGSKSQPDSGGPQLDKAQILPPSIRSRCVELVARSLEVQAALDRIVGDTPVMRRVRGDGWSAAFGESLANVHSLGPLIQSTPVLIIGETGTGKELIGQALCRSMPGKWEEKDSRWVPARNESVHLASLPDTLVESTLFGHAKEAFTGAHKEVTGVLERCHRGVVFLDEVAELPLKTQVALLRTLQEGKVRRLGDSEDKDAAPRVVSATHQSLDRLIEEGRFREDLYHRLSSVVLTLPPLRERRDDIPLLAEAEISKADAALRGVLKDRVTQFLDKARDYPWPGNVRELSKIVRTLALGLSPALASSRRERLDVPEEVVSGSWDLEQVKSWYANRVRARSSSATEAAQRLDVDRGTLRKLLEPHESDA